MANQYSEEQQRLLKEDKAEQQNRLENEQIELNGIQDRTKQAEVFSNKLKIIQAQKAIAARTLKGVVTRVIDGDTVQFKADGESYPTTIRFPRTNANEISKSGQPGQPGGDEALRALEKLVLQQRVTIDALKVDKYRRVIATIKTDKGQDPEKELVKAGLSRPFNRYLSADQKKEFASYEASARQNKSGIWGMSDSRAQMDPSDWLKGARIPTTPIADLAPIRTATVQRQRAIVAKIATAVMKPSAAETSQDNSLIKHIATIVRNSTTPSGGPPLTTLERVNSILGMSGTANAIGQSIKPGGNAGTFVNTYMQDLIRGVVEASTGTQMKVPGGRVEGVDLAKKMGIKGNWGKAAGVGIEMATDPLTFGKGPVAPLFNYLGKAFQQARRIPGISTAYTRIAQSLNKFHDVEQLSNSSFIKDAFQKALTPGGQDINITKLTKVMEPFGTPFTPEIGALRKSINTTQGQIDKRMFRLDKMQGVANPTQITALQSQVQILTKDLAHDQRLFEGILRNTPVPAGANVSKSQSLKGLSFDAPVRDLIDKELEATFLHSSRNTIAEKTLGGMKDVTTLVKKAVTVIDPFFHIRNLADNIYKTYLEKVSASDYWQAVKTKYAKGPAAMKERAKYAEKGILSQVGPLDIQDEGKTGLISKIAVALNDIPRLAMAKSLQKKGTSLSKAGELVNRTMIDYRPKMVSPLVAAMGNRYTPFIKYEAGNPWTYLSSMDRYSGQMGKIEKVQRNTNDEKDRWKIPEGDRGRIKVFNKTGLGTSFEDLTSIGDKGIVDRLAKAVHPLITLFAEMSTGWDAWRNRPIKGREPAGKYAEMAGLMPFFRDAMDIKQENGTWTMNGPRAKMMSVANRAIGMGANYLNAAEGSGSWIQSLTGVRDVGVQPAWAAARERKALNTKSWTPWSNAVGAANAWAGGVSPAPIVNETWKSPYAASNTKPLPVPMVTISLADLTTWAKAANLPEMDAAHQMRQFLGSGFDYFNGDPAAKARERMLSANLDAQQTIARNAGRAAPLGDQWTVSRMALAQQQANEIRLKVPGAEGEKLAAINTKMLLASIKSIMLTGEQIKALPYGQLDRSQGAYTKDLRTAETSWQGLRGEFRAAGKEKGPDRIYEEHVAKLENKINEVQAFNRKVGDEEKKSATLEMLQAITVKTQEWYDEVQRDMDKITKRASEAVTDPREKLAMDQASEVRDFMHQKSTIELLNRRKATEDPEKIAAIDEQIDTNLRIIDAIYVKKGHDLNLKILGEQSTQLDAFVKEKSAAAAAILKQAFESGEIGIGSYFDSQRKVVNDEASKAIANQSGMLDAAALPIQGTFFGDSMKALATSGNFEDLQKNREALTNAGVDVEAFFKAAAEISQIIFNRSKQIAGLAVGEKDFRSTYESALAGLQATTATTKEQADTLAKTNRYITPTLQEQRSAFTTKFDAESRKQRTDLEKTMNFVPLSPGDIDEKDPKDLEEYYKTKEALAKNDVERERVRVESLIGIDRAFWFTKVSAAQAGTDLLVGLTTQLYELSGKKSKEMFYMMKAAAIASATVKGYEAAVSAWKSGNDINPYVGAAFVAVSMAMTSAQIANIVAQQMAKGGPIVGGSGRRDDVPIMGMGGEYMVQKKAVSKYGVNFMNAINEGKADSRDFSIPAVPSRVHSGIGYAVGGFVPSSDTGSGTTNIVLENRTNQNMKMTEGGSKFDGKRMVKSIILDLADTDPGFASMFQGGR